MIDLLLLLVAVAVAAYATYPPRGNARGWLIAALMVLWAGLVVIGWRRGVLAGFEGWLVVLALMAAMTGLLVIWSATNIIGTPRIPPEPHDTADQE